MIGSLMLDVAAPTLSAVDLDLLRQAQVGGVILFARNIQTPEQVRQLTDSIRAVRPELLVAVDQEGGRVRRLRDLFSQIPAMGELGVLYASQPDRALKLCESCAVVLAAEVMSVGIDFSFAPVLDLGGISQVIGDRAFAQHPEAVTELSAAFMRGLKSLNMANCAKHFPGHGSCAPDSHHAQAIDERTLEQIKSLDMQPFVNNLELIDSMMPAHVIYPALDDRPAGFSSAWIKGVIREELGFTGALFSDDLSMKAACVAGDAGDRAIAALAAGCDMALVCNDRSAAMQALSALESIAMPNQARLESMRGVIKPWLGSLRETANQYQGYAAACEVLGASDLIAAFAE